MVRSESNGARVGAVNFFFFFSFISTYFLEVFRLTRFQRALAEHYVPCHYWFYWELAVMKTIHTALFCCLWEISTPWPCSVRRDNHVMTKMMILTHRRGLWRMMFVQASEWHKSEWHRRPMFSMILFLKEAGIIAEELDCWVYLCMSQKRKKNWHFLTQSYRKNKAFSTVGEKKTYSA